MSREATIGIVPTSGGIKDKETGLQEHGKVIRAWRWELGRSILGGSDVTKTKETAEEAKKNITEDKYPPDYQEVQEKKRAERQKKPLAKREHEIAEKLNTEALGRWVLDWKQEGHNDADFSAELDRQRSKTKSLNALGDLSSDAEISGGAPGQAAVLGINPFGITKLVQAFTYLNGLDMVQSPDVIKRMDSIEAYMDANGVYGNPALLAQYNAFLGQLTGWANTLRTAESSGGGGYRIITSEIAEAEFNALPNNFAAREAWVRDKLGQILAAGKPSGGFVGANFAPYQLLSGADFAIKQFNRDLWGEIHHTFGLMDLGSAVKNAAEIKDIFQGASSVSAETLHQLFRTKIRRQIDGAEIFGVAEAMRLYEEHKGDLIGRHPDNNGSFMTAIAWTLEGYSWAQAKAWAADPSHPFPPNMWAAQDAESFWFGTLRGIVEAVDINDGKPKKNSTVYPAFRLATLEGSNKTVTRFFREKDEGKKYMKPFLVDFWTYVGESTLDDNGRPKTVDGVVPPVNEALTQNFINAGLLMPGPNGTYRVPDNLQHVRFENLILSQNDVSVVKGVIPKYFAYVSTSDHIREATEPGGFYNSPSMESFSELVAKTGLWKNLEPRPRREEAYCFIAEGIIEFLHKKGAVAGIGGTSHVEKELPGLRKPIENRTQLIIELGKVLSPPFDVPKTSPAFIKLVGKYNLSPRDFATNPFKIW